MLERPEAEPLAAEPRTNELDADERRRIVGGEEAGVGGGTGWWLSRARVVVGEGLSCTHPVAGQAAGDHDRGIRGPGCSVRSSSAAGPARAVCELARGVLILPVVGPARCRLGVHVLSAVVSAVVSVSRW